MECPRCDRPLDRYALGGREAVACEGCGYIGVPVEHRGELREVESWDDAISRFEEVGRVEAGRVETTEDDPTPEVVLEDVDEEAEPTVVRIETPAETVPVDGDGDDATLDGAGDGETAANGESEGVVCEVCGARFERQAQLDGHSAVHADEE